MDLRQSSEKESFVNVGHGAGCEVKIHQRESAGGHVSQRGIGLGRVIAQDEGIPRASKDRVQKTKLGGVELGVAIVNHHQPIALATGIEVPASRVKAKNPPGNVV